MRREQLEHLIRAAAGVLGEREVIVIGSQSVLASIGEADLPRAATLSIEADIVPLDDPDGGKATLVDGSIGEDSLFHEAFGVYAHGVGEGTAVLPSGWRDRLVPYRNANTSGVVGWCLEPHDLVVAKLVAGRPHDLTFVRELLHAGLVDPEVVGVRLGLVDARERRVPSARRALQALRRRSSGSAPPG